MNKSAILAVRIIGDATVAVEAFDDAEDAAKSFEGTMDKLKDGAMLAGAAAGTALAAGVYGAFENAQAENKLAGQLGLDAAESERLGGIAGQLYADAYGDSLESVNEALRGVMGNIDGMAGASDEDLSRITGKVSSLATAFDQDLGATTTAVGQLIRTGMARDADEALDIITRGLQNNARAGEDLIDTYTEYPALFQRLGIDGQTAGGLIAQGMAAGARSTDLVADALKEFQIRSTDASTASAAAYEALGLNAADMTAQMARGGEDAAAGLDVVLDRLRGMTDPVAQNAAAVGLFGTQAEDLGSALYALDPSEAVAALGEVTDASARLDETMSKDQGFEKLKRSVEQTFTSIGADALPVLEPILGFLTEMSPVLGPIALALAGFAAGFTVVSGAMKVYAAVQAIQTAAQWASNAAWLASPITWIVLAVVAAIALVIAIVVLLVENWDTVARVADETFTNVGNFIGDVGRVFGEVLGNIGRWFDDLFNNARRGFDNFVGWIRNAIDWLGRLVNNATPGWVKDLMGMSGQTFSARVAVEEPAMMMRSMAFSDEETFTAFAQPMSLASTSASLSSDSGGTGGDRAAAGNSTTINVNFNGLVTDPEAAAREIRKLLDDSDQLNGRRVAVVTK